MIKKVVPWLVLVGVVLLSFFLLQRATQGIFSPFGAGLARVSPTPFKPIPASPTMDPTILPTTIPTSTPAPPSIWIHPNLPDGLIARARIPEGMTRADAPEQATFRVDVGQGNPISNWIYALVAPFPTVLDGVTGQALKDAWNGQSNPNFGGSPLLVTESTLYVFSRLWGDPAAGAVRVVEEDQLMDLAWESRPSWALLPFEQLSPRWKVLAVDGRTPIEKGFDLQGYALKVPISLAGEPLEASVLPASNRDADKLTTLVMTGVTALVRATAYTMEQQGVVYPAQDIRGWLRGADITHISNEVPFAENCPYPNPTQKSLRFCSDPRYIKLLEYIGTDVVELTGDHFGDWGPEATLYTLDLYDQRGWPYYGGGKNRQQARKPVILEHNGNRLAFIGCNAKGGGYALAGANTPGAVACDFGYMTEEIQALREDGVLPVATFQHFEFYTYQAQPVQVRDAAKLTRAGAVIVSGSQAHQPQAFEIQQDSFVHHGLGNLFFDQYTSSPNVPETRKAFIDRHVIYDGEHISTELLTIMFVDYARARPMTPAERKALLERTFSASGW